MRRTCEICWICRISPPLFFSSKDQKSNISESESSMNSRTCLGHLVLFSEKLFGLEFKCSFTFFTYLLDELTGYTKLQLSNNDFLFHLFFILLTFHISHKSFSNEVASLEVSSWGQLDEAGFKSVEIETAQRTHIWRNFKLQSQSFCLGLMKTQIT